MLGMSGGTKLSGMFVKYLLEKSGTLAKACHRIRRLVLAVNHLRLIAF